MAQLIPEDLPVEHFKDPAERRTVEALLRLPHSWLIIPNLRLYRDYERELDIVLIHPRAGVVLIEVKGFRPTVRRGAWYSEHGKIQENPYHQAVNNSFALRDRVNKLLGSTVLRSIPSAVAFPRASSFKGKLPADRKPCQLILGSDLSNEDKLVDKVFELAATATLTNFDEDVVNAIIAEIAPDADFTWDANSEQRAARQLLQQLSDQQIEGFASLDVNRQVFVRGRAGTGKTRLAKEWARRAAVHRDERVLLTCWNEPLGLGLQAQLAHVDGVVARPFLLLLCDYLGVSGPPEGTDKNTWWDHTLAQQVAALLPEHPQRFDTIVIDEVQDFFPHWIDVAMLLLDPQGPQRILLLGDEYQDINGRGFEAPPMEGGWVHAELQRNCRNSDLIARLLRRKLNGAMPSPAAPIGRPCTFVTASDGDHVSRAVGELVHQRIIEEGRDPGSIGVVTFGRSLRDRISADHGFPQDPEGDSTCVGTPHRFKGLEFDTVIVATTDPNPSDVMFYIGVSRAVSELIVVGPTEVGERLGLATDAA
jgi:hypothetical protein